MVGHEVIEPPPAVGFHLEQEDVLHERCQQQGRAVAPCGFGQEGLITIDQDAEEEKTRIAVAAPARVQQALGGLPEDLCADIAAILDQYGELEHNRLLKTVYAKYPAYAKKSRLLKGARKPPKRSGRSS